MDKSRNRQYPLLTWTGPFISAPLFFNGYTKIFVLLIQVSFITILLLAVFKRGLRKHKVGSYRDGVQLDNEELEHWYGRMGQDAASKAQPRFIHKRCV